MNKKNLFSLICAFSLCITFMRAGDGDLGTLVDQGSDEVVEVRKTDEDQSLLYKQDIVCLTGSILAQIGQKLELGKEDSLETLENDFQKASIKFAKNMDSYFSNKYVIKQLIEENTIRFDSKLMNVLYGAFPDKKWDSESQFKNIFITTIAVCFENLRHVKYEDGLFSDDTKNECLNSDEVEFEKFAKTRWFSRLIGCFRRRK